LREWHDFCLSAQTGWGRLMTMPLSGQDRRPMPFARSLALAAVLATAVPGLAQTPGSAPPASAQQAEEAALRKLIADSASRLAALPGFEVTFTGSYDSVQPSGEKIEFNEIRRISLLRPGKLRIEQVESDGSLTVILFDGAKIRVLDPQTGVFAEAPQPGSIDDAVIYLVRDLKIRLPLAMMLTSRFGEDLAGRIQTVSYVEWTDILGRPAHHLAARGVGVDMQVWISDDDEKQPLRIVLTYPTEPGQPQVRTLFLDWKPGAPDAERFKWDPPAGARGVPFQSQFEGQK
jgi:hypothetical protein